MVSLRKVFLLLILLPTVAIADNPDFVYAPLKLTVSLKHERQEPPDIHIHWSESRLDFQEQFYLLSPNRILLDFTKKGDFRVEHHTAPGLEQLKKLAIHNHEKRVSIELYVGDVFTSCESFIGLTGDPGTLILRCKKPVVLAEAEVREKKEGEDIKELIHSLESRMQRRERQLQRLLNRIEFEEYGELRRANPARSAKRDAYTIPYSFLSLALFSILVLFIVFQRFTIRQLRFATLRRPHRMSEKRSEKKYFKNLEVPEPDVPEGRSLLSCYRLLGVSSDWSDEEIREHYKELITRYHPDSFRNKSLSEDMKRSFHQRYTSIVQAYEMVMTTRSLGRTMKHPFDQ